MQVEDLLWHESTNKRFNSPLLPHSIRGLIVGKSGCGKTTLLLNMLLRPGWLDYNKLFVFSRSLFQPEYRILKKVLEEKLPKEAIIRLFDNQEEIQELNVPPSALIEVMSRTGNLKSDIDCEFYETSEALPDPRELSPMQKNLIVFDDLMLEKQNKCDHVSSDMSKDEFQNLCKEAWKSTHGFVVIDLSSKKHCGRYRKGLDEFFIPT